MEWHREVFDSDDRAFVDWDSSEVPCKSWVFQHGREKIEPQPNATEECKSIMMISQNLTPMVS